VISKEAILILLQRTWQAFAGLITVLLVATYFSPLEQGWYYAFTSLAALVSLIELGLSSAILHSTAFYFSEKKSNQLLVLEEKKPIFFSFIKQAFYKYLRLSLIYISLLSFFGYLYFNEKGIYAELIEWKAQWFLLIIFTAISLLISPFLSIVEGAGSISEVYFVRLMQGILASISCWIVIVNNGTLWATVIIPFVSTFVAVIWLKNWRYDLIKKSNYSYSNNNLFKWDKEIKPLQNKVAISWLGAYFMSQLSTPILFFYCDPVVAGKMGLSLTIAHMIGHLSQIPIIKTIPNLYITSFNKSFTFKDNLFSKSVGEFLLFFILGSCLFVLVFIYILPVEYSNRLLSLVEILKLLIFVLFYQICQAFSIHLRAFKFEPLFPIYALGAFLTVFGSIYIASSRQASGIIDVMLIIQAFIVFPLCLYIWSKTFKKIN
jgi:hypothetical protein